MKIYDCDVLPYSTFWKLRTVFSESLIFAKAACHWFDCLDCEFPIFLQHYDSDISVVHNQIVVFVASMKNYSPLQ